MKVFMMTDLEGVSMCGSGMLWDRTHSEYARACLRLAEDINAAVRGALAAGADEILVVDGHGGGNNLNAGLLLPPARQVHDYGELKDCAALLLIGTHARAGTQHAFLDHTQSSQRWHHYFINGIPRGEIAQEAAMAGSCGVPLVMVSGDDAACREAAALIPGVECAAVKTGLCRETARCLPAGEAQSRIFEAAKRGVLRAREIPPFLIDLPAQIAVEFNTTAQCDYALQANAQLSRLDGYTAVKTIARIGSFEDLVL